jgi:sec-independent protein translocase protein TatB
MFDIGWGEFLVIGIVALIAIGPKELPGVLRSVGQWIGKIRQMAGEFQGQFQEAMREAEMAELKKEVDEMTAAARGFSSFDPLDTVRKEMESAVEGKTSAPATADSAVIPAVPVEAPPPVAAIAPATPSKPESGAPAETRKPAEEQRG